MNGHRFPAPAGRSERRRALRQLWTGFAFLPHLVATITTLLGLWVDDPRTGMTIIGVSSCVFAVTIALRRGHNFLPPSSVFFIATGVFVGGGCYYLMIVDTAVPEAQIRDAAGLTMLTTIGIALVVTAQALVRRIDWPADQSWTSPRPVPNPPLGLFLWGVGLLVASQLPPVVALVGPPANSFGVGGVLMIVVWASTRRFHLRWFGDLGVLALVMLLPLFWTNVVFNGYGRLAIAGLCIASFVAWNTLSPSRLHKLGVVLAIPVFLIIAGQNRNETVGGTGSSAGSTLSSGDGLASVYAPLETFGRMLGPLEPAARDELGPRWGATFVNSFVMPVPRSLWEDKPEGFGTELTLVFEPKSANINHSMAALLQGEFYANFWYFGMPILVLVVGPFLTILDRWHARLARSRFDRDKDFYSLAVLVCIVSSLGELVWVGTFTAYARGGLAAVSVAIISVMANRRHPRPVAGSPPRPDQQQPRSEPLPLAPGGGVAGRR